MNDSECITLLKQNDIAGLNALIDTYGHYVAKILQGFLGSGLSVQDLEEITSDVFFALWQHRARLSQTESLKGYIAAIARNTGRKRLKRLKRVEPLPEDFELVSDQPTPEETAEQSQSRQTAVLLMDALEKTDREIFYRFYFLRQTTREIAKTMNMNKSTVMSRLARGRASLKTKLGEVQYDY